MNLDLEFVRSHFPALESGFVFLDNAGGSQTLRNVPELIEDYLLNCNVQHGATYAVSEEAATHLKHAQAAMAVFMNSSRVEEIVFGSSATMLTRLLAEAMASRFEEGDEIIVCRHDHEANIGPWVAMEKHGVEVRWWKHNPDTWRLEPDDLRGLLTERTRFIAFNHVSNILGTINPVTELTDIAHDAGVRVCVDGVAWASHRRMDMQALRPDFYIWSTYKVFGPHCAIMYGDYDALLDLDNVNHYVIPRDSIPNKLQPGNPNYELAWGCTAIRDYIEGLARRHDVIEPFDLIAAYEQQLADRLLTFLAGKPGVKVFGAPSSGSAERVSTISFVVVGRDSKAIVEAVDPHGIGIRYGHFYSVRLIEDLGLAPQNGVVRVSMIHYNTEAEVDRLIQVLDTIL